MCWKHEWAKAHNRLNRAVFYLGRARLKLETRKEYADGAEECRELIETFQESQKTLEALIDDQGRSETLQEVMHPHYEEWGKVKEWVDKN